MKSVNKNKNDELCYESRKVERLMERLAAVQAAGVYFIEDSDMGSRVYSCHQAGPGRGPHYQAHIWPISSVTGDWLPAIVNTRPAAHISHYFLSPGPRRGWVVKFVSTNLEHVTEINFICITLL